MSLPRLDSLRSCWQAKAAQCQCYFRVNYAAGNLNIGITEMCCVCQANQNHINTFSCIWIFCCIFSLWSLKYAKSVLRFMVCCAALYCRKPWTFHLSVWFYVYSTPSWFHCHVTTASGLAARPRPSSRSAWTSALSAWTLTYCHWRATIATRTSQHTWSVGLTSLTTDIAANRQECQKVLTYHLVGP